MEKLSYASESSTSPWTTYLRQIDRVAPYLGDLAYCGNPAPSETRADRRHSCANGRRHHPPLRGLSRSAQSVARTG